jgi:hypothetical protein
MSPKLESSHPGFSYYTIEFRWQNKISPKLEKKYPTVWGCRWNSPSFPQFTSWLHSFIPAQAQVISGMHWRVSSEKTFPRVSHNSHHGVAMEAGCKWSVYCMAVLPYHVSNSCILHPYGLCCRLCWVFLDAVIYNVGRVAAPVALVYPSHAIEALEPRVRHHRLRPWEEVRDAQDHQR